MIFKVLLLPFSLIYFIVSMFYHWYYDLFSNKSYKPEITSISVGNLSMGGTGKTPMIVWLANQFVKTHQTLIISRGYGRKSKGFYEVDKNMSHSQVGDEPLLFKQIFGNQLKVAVCEKRKIGIQKMRNLYTDISFVLLDDAFQHRSIIPGFSIVLTTFDNPFFDDLPIPSGRLREPIQGIKRSDLVIVTKCPENLLKSDKEKYLKKLSKFNKPVFFSSIVYNSIIPISDLIVDNIENVLLVTGIATPAPLLAYLELNYNVLHIKYSDHYSYTVDDINHIHQKFDNFASNNKIILTTEKDFVRFKDNKLYNYINLHPWYKISISLKFDNENSLIQLIENYVRKN